MSEYLLLPAEAGFSAVGAFKLIIPKSLMRSTNSFSCSSCNFFVSAGIGCKYGSRSPNFIKSQTIKMAATRYNDSGAGLCEIVSVFAVIAAAVAGTPVTGAVAAPVGGGTLVLASSSTTATLLW